jgi:hypothetical protein
MAPKPRSWVCVCPACGETTMAEDSSLVAQQAEEIARLNEEVKHLLASVDHHVTYEARFRAALQALRPLITGEWSSYLRGIEIIEEALRAGEAK